MKRTGGQIVGPPESENRQIAAQCVLWLALALAAPATLAQGVAPDVLVRTVTIGVTEQIKQDPKLRAGDPEKVAALIETRILPLFDFAHMTRLAMAHNWRLATPEQRKVLTEEFKMLLLHSYSTAILRYRGEVINVKQLRVAALGTDVLVRSEVKMAGKEPMTLDYQMERTAAGWKIYDIKVAGVSLISTHRDLFAEKIREGGVDGLIRFLADGNRKGSSRFNSITNAFWEKSRVIYTIFQDIIRNVAR